MRKTRDLYRTHPLLRTLTGRAAHAVGHPLSFAIAVLAIVAWALLGALVHLSETWRLVGHTATTIVTLFVVFLVQHTQNRSGHAMNLKLDELIFANKNARNWMIALEELSEEELKDLEREFDRLACEKVARRRTKRAPSLHDRSRPS